MRERERERESTHFFGGREVAVTGGLALELSSSHLSKLKHRTERERERERESACVSAETGSASGFEHSIFSSTYCKS